MIHRTFSRVARTAIASVALAAAVPLLTGCDSKGAGNAGPQTAPAAVAATGGSGGVGVVDSRRITEALQWDAEQKRDTDVVNADVGRELGAFLQQLSTLVAEKRKGMIAAGKLSNDQIDKLNNMDLDGLPLSREQKTEYRLIISNAVQYEQQARQLAQNVLNERRAQVERMYTEAVRPAVRRAAQTSGVQTVLLKQNVFYNDAAAELTDRVIDELQKAPPPRTYPPVPKLNLPQVRLDEPPRPTTGPSTGPAPAGASSTQPAR